MPDFRSMLQSGKRLLFDGAMGTMLQLRGLPPGQEPEVFCLQHPDVLRGVHVDYAKAGADVLTTNTFGGSRFKLPAGIAVHDFNVKMARAAREAAAVCGGRTVYVAGSIGPSGKFIKPLGELDFEDLVDGFREQIRGLVEGGVDLIIAETQFDIHEVRAIVLAARRECDLPIAVSMTYEDGRTLTGSGVELCVATLANMGVDLIGMNCSAGPVEMRAAADDLLACCPVPVLIQPNAGLPVLVDGATVFPLDPAAFASLTGEFAADGAQCVGGCCGTSPNHIAALRKATDTLKAPQQRPIIPGVALSTRSHLLRIGSGQPIRCIGERINPTGKKTLSMELQAGEFREAFRFADEQIQAGALILDVNVGAPMVDETVCLPDLVAQLVSRHPVPLAFDSSNMDAVEKALAVYPGSPLVNSISGEEGRLERLGPLCRDYGAPFILLPLKGKKLPVKAVERIAILEELLAGLDALRIPRRLAMVDALVLAASSSPEAAGECLRFIRYCTEQLGLPTTCGLSNISFGLPARELLNAGFLSLATGAGLCSCIANPSNVRFTEALDAANLLLGNDAGAESFIAGYAGWKSGPEGTTSARGATSAGGATSARTTSSESGGTGSGAAGGHSGDLGVSGRTGESSSLEQAVIAGRRDEITALVQSALDGGAEPYAIVGERLIPAITEVGKKYERKEYFLPQLIRSAETMQTAFAFLRPLLEQDIRSGERPLIITATVEGDIHDIGKNIVNLLLGNHGFQVMDLGKDVKAEDIVAAAEEHKAAVIGLSALMTTTMVRMQDTVDLLREKGLPQKVMIGGAVVTDDFAKSIGAHYSKDAVEAVRLAQSLVQ